MNKSAKISIIIGIFLTFFSWAASARAEFSITSAKATKIENGHANLTWGTSSPTKAVVYYGQSQDKLDIVIHYDLYGYEHDLILNGLEKDKTYYFKIISQDRSGEEVATFVQSFSTKDMADTIAPKFIYKNAEQITANAAALRWVTNEDTRGTIYYGIENSSRVPEQTTGDGALKKDHMVYLYNLINDQPYYAKLKAADNAGNIAEHTYYFVPKGPIKDGSIFEIYGVKPLSYDGELIRPESATILWGSTLVSAGSLSYGTAPGRYSWNVIADNGAYALEHRAELGQLTPNTTYYYVINARDSLYQKNLVSPEYSFSTSVPQKSLGVKIVEEKADLDSDQDGLMDAYESEIGTDPYNSDSDGDGYDDGLEVKNNYNPLGYGRAVQQILSRPAILSVNEKNKLADLKKQINARIGQTKIDKRSWLTLANAYVYGGYSAEDVVRAIGGAKTVHPSFSREVWETSADYQQDSY